MLEEFAMIGKELFESGLVDSHGGDMSIRRGDRIFITKRDRMLHHLKEEDLLEVGLEKDPDADKDASREVNVHRAIYKNTDAKAVLHAHPVSATAISISDNKVVPLDADGLSTLKAVPIVRANEPIGSEDVARILPTLIGKTGGVAMVKGHGSFAAASSLEEAYKLTSILERSSSIILSLRSAQPARPPQREQHAPQHRGAIPPGIGVMDRSRYRRGNIQNR